MSLREIGVIKKEPTMSDALSKLKDNLERDIGEEAARSYAQPRHREPPRQSDIDAHERMWQGDALSSVQTTILRMTYGEMMDFSKGLVASLHHQDKEIDEGVMAKALHHWAVTYREETEK